MNPLDSTPLKDFSGVITLTVHDGDVSLIRNEDPPTGTDDYKYTKYGPVIARAAGKVENGETTVEFILPKDISFSDKTGRIFAYAVSGDNRFASGETRKIKTTGIDFGSYSDEKGPNIDLFIDSRKFQSGDLVQSSPTLIVDLADETGINTTGLGIGHSIEAWLDNSNESINLNAKFENSIEDGRRGTAKVLLSKLSPGEHSVKVRAWDIFNNYSIARINFTVSEEGANYRITKSWNYPNPIGSTGTVIAFKHNLPVPFKVEINIYNSLGARVKSLHDISLTSLYSESLWDVKDENGSPLPAGAYFVQIIAGDAAIGGCTAIVLGI